jgi:hypothetical protein
MLHYNTVNSLLKNTLSILMDVSIFDAFRLVGGTALSLQIGHRESIDIDLFSDASYGSINFEEIDTYLNENFEYCDTLDIIPALGKSYFIGKDKANNVKLDVYYTDSFIQPYISKDNIRMASIEEIIAMKVDVIQRGGRKKDFWDLHELLNTHSINQMLDLHKQRYSYNHDKDLIIQNFTRFEQADNDFDPVCLKGKNWEFIKEDFENVVLLEN